MEVLTGVVVRFTVLIVIVETLLVLRWKNRNESEL
jgi:hypothetical protein